MDLLKINISELANAIKNKKISSVEATEFFLKRINTHDKKLNSFISINDKAVEQAKLIDDKISKGENLGSMAGVPISIKDMLCTKNLKTTAGSKMLSNFIPPYDSTVVARLKQAGAVILGKTNLDEFAMGSSNETSFYGPVKNPWNTAYVAGGSSGGSASAQAARFGMGTIGTDTGGSIRQPASFCGVVGLKPTYGRVSRYGIVAYASSLDQAGPITNSVADAALMLEVISGHDQNDGTTSQRSVPNFSHLLNACDSKNLQSLKNLKIGVIKEYMKGGGLCEDTNATFNAALDAAKKLGAEIVEVSIDMSEHAVPMYYLIAASEASSNLARYDGVRFGHRASFENLSGIELDKFYSRNRGEGFGSEVQRRIMIGTYALSSGYYDAYYNKACQVRRLLTNQFINAFKQCDVIASPVTATPAFKIGERISDPLKMYLNDIFTTSTNLAGLPGMSVPFGLSKDKLPIGVQLTAGHFAEEKMLKVASALEANTTVTGVLPHDFN